MVKIDYVKNSQIIDYKHAGETLREVHRERYGMKLPTFQGAKHITNPSTVDVIDACRSLMDLAKMYPHYLEGDAVGIHNNLVNCVVNLRQSYEKRTIADAEKAELERKRKKHIERVTKVAMGVSGIPSKPSKSAVQKHLETYTVAQLQKMLDKKRGGNG